MFGNHAHANLPEAREAEAPGHDAGVGCDDNHVEHGLHREDPLGSMP